jgi:hypothetical protein
MRTTFIFQVSCCGPPHHSLRTQSQNTLLEIKKKEKKNQSRGWNGMLGQRQASPQRSVLPRSVHLEPDKRNTVPKYYCLLPLCEPSCRPVHRE